MRPFTLDEFRSDPLELAPALLGATLIHELPSGERAVGRIVETEAYRGEEDQACHAKAGRTKRTEVMYADGGCAYVYLIYGMYHLLNVVCWPQDQPAAVLIRSIEPISGIEGDTRGPGRLTRAMGIGREHNRLRFGESSLHLYHGSDEPKVATGPRVGVDYAGEWAAKPWRFWIDGSKWRSK